MAIVAFLPVVLMGGGVVYAADNADKIIQSQAALGQATQNKENAIANKEKVREDFVKANAELEAAEKAKAEDDSFGVDVEVDDRLEDAQRAVEEIAQEYERTKAAVEAATEAEKLATQNLANVEKAVTDDINSQKQSILPSTKTTINDCKAVLNTVHMNTTVAKQKFVDRDDVYIKEVLGCGIKTGDISLWMVPYYIRFILEFILQLGGLVAVGGIIYGGYLYLFAGISDDKDRGKKAIIYGVGGIILAMTAWALVNIVISVVTA